MVTHDGIELLLPDVSAERRAEARRLVTCLRLLVDSSRRTPAAVVALTLDRARAELEGHSRRRLLAAVLDLTRHCLYADVGRDAFAWFGEPSLDVQSAWSRLEQDRDERDGLPEVPAPNELAASTTARLLDAARRLGLSADEERLWSVRAVRAHRGLEAGESSARELATRLSESRSLLAADATALWIECLFDRGALRAARHALDEIAPSTRGHARLERLHEWSRLLFDEDESARDGEEPSIWSGRLPAALLELRAARPEWIARLAGKNVPACEHETGGFARGFDSSFVPTATWVRRTVGALAVAVFVLREHGREEWLEVDVAAGLRSQIPEWRRNLVGACSETQSAEHQLVVEARPVMRHRRALQSLRSSLAPNQVRALALAPVFDESNEVIGWLRLEFEHHLIPSTRRLIELGALWRERVRAPHAASMVAEVAPQPPTARVIDLQRHDEGASDGPCAEVFRGLIEHLGMKTAQRRWWGFDVIDGDAHSVVEGGASIGSAAPDCGGRRALVRALRSSGPVRFDECSPEMSLLRASASGVVLPITSRGRLRGLLAIESTRRHDFTAAVVARWTERARACGTELAIAQFRAWHRSKFGSDVSYSIEGARSAAWIDEVLASARSHAPCLVSGPSGCGKRIVARWLHFEGAGREAPMIVVSAGSDDSLLRGDAWREVVRRAASGTIVVEDIERWSPQAQARLVAHLDEESVAVAPAPRWILIAGVALPELALSGVVRGELCRRLARLETRVPSLAERRAELPRLIHVLLRRFAEQERVQLPTLDDTATALLWRQAWAGNVRELENLLFKLVLLQAGQEIDAERLDGLARRFGVELARKVPSRAADPEIVRAALASTVNLRGSINKTRAAMYLGWDPDTLVARMSEFGLLERADGAEPPHENGAPPAVDDASPQE